MEYKKNTETGQIIKYSDKTHGSDFRKEPWVEGTEQEYNNYIQSENLKRKKELKKDELREKHIDSQIQSQLNAVDSVISEEELNNIIGA